MNPKIKTMAVKTQMNQKKPTEISEKELFTDLTFPTGFFAKLFKQIKFHKPTLEMCQIFYSNTKLHHFTKKIQRNFDRRQWVVPSIFDTISADLIGE